MTDMHIPESLCFDDVLMLPRQSSVKSRQDIDVGTNLSNNPHERSLHLKKPFISAPMDTVTDSKMAIHMALNGGLGVIHRFMSLAEQTSEVARVKRYVNYIFANPYTITVDATIGDAIKKIEETGVTTLCVTESVQSSNKLYLKGLITNRDIAPYMRNMNNLCIMNTKVSTIMTPFKKLKTIGVALSSINDIESDANYLDMVMTNAQRIMRDNKIEKIPVVRAYHHTDYEYGDVNNDEPIRSNELMGMITYRSVEFYMYRRQKACLDRQGRLCVGAAVGIRGDYLDRAKQLVNAGADLICVDVANGHNNYTVQAVKELRKVLPYTIIMAGNVVTSEGYLELAKAGADCIRVGIGNGSICTTRLETGIGYGQFSAIRDIYAAKSHITLGPSPVIISDGGSLGLTGNKMKALAAGADAVMLGRSLAKCEESPGRVIIKNGKRMKYYRGMASTMASLSNKERQQTGEMDSKRAKLTNDNKTEGTGAEGIDGLVEIECSVKEKLESIDAGIRSGMSYLNVFSLHDLDTIRDFIRWRRSTAVGQKETGTRINKL